MKGQKLISIDADTKNLIDNYYKVKGFTTRSSYIKSLVQRDNILNHNTVNPELLI